VKTDQELLEQGFTDSGRDRYKKTAGEYCDTLYTKSLALGDRDKADGFPREVTHDHVKAAAHVIASSYGKRGTSRLTVICQIGEYVCAIAAGVGGSNLSEKWGGIVFGTGLTIGIILFVVRNTRKE